MELNVIIEVADSIRHQKILAEQSAPPVSVVAVAFKNAQFSPIKAAVWLLRLKDVFATHTTAITNDTINFHHVVQILDFSTFRRVQAVLEIPPSTSNVRPS